MYNSLFHWLRWYVCPHSLTQKYVQMSALDDKDVPSAEQWRDAVAFMTSALSRQIKQAETDLGKLAGATSFYDRWILWKSQSSSQVC